MPPRPRAVLVLAGGIGDLLRWASLVPVLAAAGHDVDLLLVADYPDSAALFDGAPGVNLCGSPTRRATGGTDRRNTAGAGRVRLLGDALPTGSASRQICADQQRWRVEATRLRHGRARELGWSGPLPCCRWHRRYAQENTVSPAPLPSTLAARLAGRGKVAWPQPAGATFWPRAARWHRPTKTPAAPVRYPIRWPAHVQDATTPRALARRTPDCPCSVVTNDSA
jgi:hypothetical protein